MKMMNKKSESILEAYTPLLGLKAISELKEKAQKFKGKTVLHVNATKMVVVSQRFYKT